MKSQTLDCDCWACETYEDNKKERILQKVQDAAFTLIGMGLIMFVYWEALMIMSGGH